LLPAFLLRKHVRGIRRAVGQLLQGLRTEVAYVVADLVVAPVVGDARLAAVDLGLLPCLPAFGATEEAAYGDALGGERAVVGAPFRSTVSTFRSREAKKFSKTSLTSPEP
jgi:hypothetical protein